MDEGIYNLMLREGKNMLKGDNSEFLKYNMVNESNLIKPDYDLKNGELSIELHISPEKELGIVGRIDNSYICWYSITTLSDKEINKEIFNYLAGNQFHMYSCENNILDSKRYEQIEQWYRCAIKREGMSWCTPFGHYYGDENKEEHGKFFADDVHSFYDYLIKLCRFRTVDGHYYKLINCYYDTLCSDNDAGYYMLMEPLISILEKESYLRLCPDIKIRELYLKCMKLRSSLYCSYMTAVR